MWKLDYKEGWAPNIRCFQTVVLEKTLENPLNIRRSKPVNPKGNQPWIFIGRTNAETLAPILWPTWCKQPPHWKRPWCWERLRSGEGDNRGQDDWMASLSQWVWVWAWSSSGRWWRTGKPGMLQSMGLQRVRHNLMTENNNKGTGLFLSSLSCFIDLYVYFCASPILFWSL